MKFGLYSGFFLFSTFKFLFTPFGGPGVGLSFWETYISCVAGGIFSAAIFYYGSEFFLHRAHKKHLAKIHEAKEKGIELPQKKKFTKTNKFIVRLKLKLGIYGISFFAPLFLSVPIGTIITAKFYGKLSKTFPLILLGMVVNGLATTGLSYAIAAFF